MLAAIPALIGASCLAAALDAQVTPPTTGSLEGVVFDSTRGGPLAEADVYLWGTHHRAVTDPGGRFLFDEIAARRYTVVFFHPRLAELGISPGSTEVDVDAGELATVRLAVPSLHTVLTALCSLEEPGIGAIAEVVPVVGRVTEAGTGVPRSGSRVTFSWPRTTLAPAGSFEVLTGEGGWFSACAVPAAVAVGVMARHDARSSRWREVEFEREHAGNLSIELRNLRPATLSGRLVDVMADTAIAGAEVSLRGTALRTLTDRDGSFRLRDVPPGEHTLVVIHPPFDPLEQSVELTSGAVATTTIRLAGGALTLAPIEVTVERLTQTERAMGGYVVGRDRIERIAGRVRDLADVLRQQNVAGLIVRRSGPAACVGFTTGQVRMTPNRGCVPVTVFIDGVRAPDPSAAFLIPAESIDHLILYRPIEASSLFGAWSADGVLEIFTRR